MFGETLKHMFSDLKYDLNSGNFWTNVVILVNFWSFNPLHVEDRLNKRVGFIFNDLWLLCSGPFRWLKESMERSWRQSSRTSSTWTLRWTKRWLKIYLISLQLPIVFVDSHYNRSVPEEVEAFNRETKLLWKTSLNRQTTQHLNQSWRKKDNFEFLDVDEALFGKLWHKFARTLNFDIV